MADADDLLAALDPEQRQVAEALRGPVRVLAGAGTGKTRAITHRIAYGVATGVYAPTEVLAVTFTTRAAGEMRGRLRPLGAAGVQARTFHSAALRQLRYFWPHVHGTELPTLTESKIGARWPPPPAGSGSTPTRRCCATSPPRSSGPRSATSTPTTTPGSRRPRPLGHRPRTRDRGAGLRQPTRRSSAPRAGWTWRTSCCSPPACSPRTSGSPPRSAASTSGSSSTSSRTSRRSSRRCSTCGSAAATSCAWSATRRRRSTPSPAPTRRYLRDFPAKFPAHHLDRAGPQLPLHPRGRRRRQHAAGPVRRAAASSCGPSARRPGGHLHAPPRRGRRGRGRRRAHRRLCATTAARRARSRCCSGSTPSPRRSRRRSPAAASPTSSAAPPGSSTAPRCARRSPCCAAPPAPAQAADDAGRRPSAARSPAWAGRTEAPAARGQTRDRWESLAGAGRPGRPSSPRADGSDLGGFVDDLDRRAAEQHAPVADGVTLATLHAAKGLEWDSVFLCRPPGRHAADHLRRDARRGRGGAPAALRRDDPGPARPRALLGAGPQPGRAGLPQALPVPRPAAPATTPRPPARPAPPRAWPAAASAASRCDRRPEEDRPLRRLPGVLRRGAVRAPARVAQGPARRRRACRRSWSSPTPRLQLIAEHKPTHRAGAAGGSTASAGPSSSATATTSWRWWTRPRRKIRRNSRNTH